MHILMQLDWNDIHYFLLLVEKQTLTATAEALGVEHSTVARRIERLEKQLNLHLFDRINKRYLLTAAGERLYPEAKKLQFNIRQFRQTAEDSQQAVSEVLLSVSPFVAHALIAPLLSLFYQRFSHIRLVLTSDPTLSSLHQRQADIALRITLPEQNDLVARRLCDIDYRWYGHQDYLADTPKDAWQYLGLHLGGTQVKWVEEQLAEKPVCFVCNDFQMMQTAIVHKLGIGLLPCDYRTEAMTELTAMPSLSTPLYLIMHEDVRHSQSVRDVADFLVEGLGG